MKMISMTSAAYIAAVLILSVALFPLASAAQQAAASGPAASQAEKKAAPAGSLADIHKGMGTACKGCHGDSLKVDDNETIVNGQCVSCHGNLEAVGKKSTAHINSHKSHLGQISCTVCHHGHTASRAYCLNCHAFDLPIPGGSATAMTKKKSAKATVDKEKTDIVIIGAGAAGYTAAITAHDAGAKVILLEKQSITGGNSLLAAGGMNAANTKVQASKGVKDSAEIMYQDTMKGGKNVSDPELVKILAERSSDSVDWLTSMGADVSDLGRLAGASVNRAHRPTGGSAVGANLINALRKNAADRKLDVRVNSTVLNVLRDSVTGRATGVQVEGKHRGLYVIEAKAVVIASGGFSANASMVESYHPEYKGMTTSNQPGATGDGMKFGEAAGGKLVDMKEIQIHPTVAAGSRILITEAVRGNGAILINKEGKRFVNELTTRDAASAAILKQPGGTAYLLFDNGIRKSLKQIEGYFHLSLVKEGATLKDLAAATGIDSSNLEATVAAYNSAFDSKNDAEFKRPDMPRPLRTSPFYTIAVQPGIHYTMGGLKINGRTEMIGIDGKPIPGLYAAGEVTGGVHGANRLGGNSISETITFGRIAGAEAAKTALKK